jgi:hypothetical protein
MFTRMFAHQFAPFVSKADVEFAPIIIVQAPFNQAILFQRANESADGIAAHAMPRANFRRVLKLSQRSRFSGLSNHEGCWGITAVPLLLDTHTSVTIGGARDVRLPVDNAEHGFTLQPESLLDIRATIERGAQSAPRPAQRAGKIPRLAEIAELIEECPGLVTAISQTLDERGEVLDSASPSWQHSPRAARHPRPYSRQAPAPAAEQQQPIPARTVGVHEKRPLRHPLRADAKGRLKGIVHDQSGSGATLWLEPIGTVDLNNEYRGLQIREQDEIQRILAATLRQSRRTGRQYQAHRERMAELDLIFARARYASMLKRRRAGLCRLARIQSAAPAQTRQRTGKMDAAAAQSAPRLHHLDQSRPPSPARSGTPSSPPT